MVESVAPEALRKPRHLPRRPGKNQKEKLKPKPATPRTATSEIIGAAPGPFGPGPGGTPGGTGRGTSNAEAADQNQIRRRLERDKKYPPASQSRREEGVSMVGFVVPKDGSVTLARLIKSSGHQRLDDEAMALLRRVSPLPPIPPEVDKTSMSLSPPLRFTIR
ncbi:MAG: TonB family protein [Deltaproteobacteria bacterium]|nr:TonB family protein [Deltaproteobacteria bacterium]